MEIVKTFIRHVEGIKLKTTFLLLAMGLSEAGFKSCAAMPNLWQFHPVYIAPVHSVV